MNLVKHRNREIQGPPTDLRGRNDPAVWVLCAIVVLIVGFVTWRVAFNHGFKTVAFAVSPGHLPSDYLGATLSTDPSVQWSASRDLEIVTWGSTGCPSLPVAIHDERQGVTIELRSRGGPCIADFGPTTSYVHPPSWLSPPTKTFNVVFQEGGSDTNSYLDPFT